MNRTKIEWTDYTWNPIKGLCPVGCWYCYARAMYKRFGWDDTLHGDENEVIAPLKLKKPSRIFVCSMMELFHPKIEKHWRDTIFEAIRICPQHTFQILTKLPQNIDRPMPDNVWLGVSVTSYLDYPEKIGFLREAKVRVKFMSIEPLLKYGFPILGYIGIPCWLDWVIVGKLTGHGKKYDPYRPWIQSIVNDARDTDTPIFLKDNLKEIWGEPLIQEFPEW